MNNKKEIYCAICGAKCKEKEKIEARKNVYYDVCTTCFNNNLTKSMKEIRVLIKMKSL